MRAYGRFLAVLTAILAAAIVGLLIVAKVPPEHVYTVLVAEQDFVALFLMLVMGVVSLLIVVGVGLRLAGKPAPHLPPFAFLAPFLGLCAPWFGVLAIVQGSRATGVTDLAILAPSIAAAVFLPTLGFALGTIAALFSRPKGA